MFLAEMKLAFRMRTLIVIFTIPIVILLASMETLLLTFPLSSPLANSFHVNFIVKALQTDTVTSFVPIFSSLPLAACYVDDLKSKFARYLLIRTNYRTYLISQILACYFSGGLVFLGGIMLMWILSLSFFLPLEETISTSPESARLLLEICILYFLNGGFWSVLGISMSTIMESRYIAYVVPYVVYYLLVILHERYLSSMFVIYPKAWTDPAAWPFGCWGAAIFLLEMTLIFALLFACRAARRLQQL